MDLKHVTQRIALRPVALGVSLLALIGGHTAYSAHSTHPAHAGHAVQAAHAGSVRTVTISVDGHTQRVQTHGDTVAKVLQAAHLQVHAHDLLVPARDVQVADRSMIVVRRGRPMALTVDGQQRTVWVTAISVDEALGQIGLRTQGATLSADRSRALPLKGFSLDVRTRKSVYVLDAGRSRRVVTNAVVVADALREAHVVVRAQDKLSPPLAAPVRSGQVIRIARIDAGREVQNLPIRFGVQRRPDGSMFQGQTRVLRPGRTGVLHRNYSLRFLNHKLSKRVLTSAHLTSRPVAQLVAYGTKARPRTTTPSSDGLNWGALAHCESGGNPRAVSSSGTYRGLYQFDFGTWRSVGGSGDPINASPGEQTYRAQLLYRRSGRSPWPVCGRHL